MSEPKIPFPFPLLDEIPDRCAAMTAAIWAWADHQQLPHTDETYNRVACALCASLAVLLAEDRPEARGWRMKNGEFVEKLTDAMLPLDDADPRMPGAAGILELKLGRKGGLVTLQYAPGVMIALPPDTARTLGEGLFSCAGEIDGRKAAVFYVGVPPRDHPEAEADRP